MSVLWRGLMQVPLTGHCAQGQDGWCALEAPYPERQAQVQPGDMLRVECRFGDKDPRYTEQRCILTAVNQTTEVEGNEKWYRWDTLYPTDWVGWWPKQDELEGWPKTGLNGGSCMEWHQQPSQGPPYFGNWNLMPGGSAPIYTGAGATEQFLTLINQKTSEPYKDFTLPLVRGRVNKHVLHAKWSKDPKVGFLEYWINEVQMAGDSKGPFSCATLYPGCDNYITVGLYRRLSIGDPTLLWPFDAKAGVTYPPVPSIPKKNTRVYPLDHGYPGVMHFGRVVMGTQRSDVDDLVPPMPTPTPPTPTPEPPVPTPTPPTPPTNDPAKCENWRQFLVNERPKLEALLASQKSVMSGLGLVMDSLKTASDATQKLLDDLITLLNQGR